MDWIIAIGTGVLMTLVFKNRLEAELNPRVETIRLSKPASRKRPIALFSR